MKLIQFMESLTTRKVMRLTLPILVIIVFSLLVTALYLNQPETKARTKRVEQAKVFVINSHEENTVLSVLSQGEVTPISVLELRAEISGKVNFTSDKLVAGGDFKRGDILLKIDPTEYELAVIQKRASVALAKQKYETAKALSTASILELNDMGRTDASDLAKGLTQLRSAQASLAAAQAQLKLAELNLSHTQLTAPFDGRVKDKFVSNSQYISKNVLLATLFATDNVEIRLPLTPEQLTQIGIPLAYFSKADASPFDVTLSMDLKETKIQWQGKIVRTEAIVDRRTRTINAVARIRSPYTKNRTPLLVGAFVQAEITGTQRFKVSELPSKALRKGSDLWIVDKNNKLQIVSANIIQRNRERLLVTGLPSGTRVVTSDLPIPVTGMPVKVVRPTPHNKDPSNVALTGSNR